ncbi:MAG: anthranilate synthase component I family protein [Labilithrix sp.]|nr:anthranilate synthase component I family protein [Labilithrix sp.]MCW5811924.1 anthranilate synthase component I family protein [Labilithrix sp.]
MKVVTRTLVSDALTPVRAYASLRASDPDGASFLLESVVGGERWGRFSILGYRPRWEAILDRIGWKMVLRRGAPPAVTLGEGGDPIASAGGLFQGRAVDGDASTAAKFAAAHVGYLAWDIVHRIEKVPAGNDATWTRHFVPLARFLGGAVVIVFDALAQTVTIAAESADDVERAYADLHRSAVLGDIAVPDRTRIPADVTTDLTDAEYKERVLAAKEYIAAGDAFQIVLARTFSVPREGRDPFDVYRAMRLVNPSPYMYFLDLPPAEGATERLCIAGASPETMVRLDADGTMTVRPLAGTRPRGKTPEEDAALEEELLADPKERAEHVMLIDLGRNDVGRVSTIGSVELVRRFEIERYSHVMHIVSEVRGKVPASTPPLEVARAAFPAGTLSGAPKVRAMQIIRELEARPRGIYGGAIGWIGGGGDLDLAIAIRTLVCKGDTFEVTAGAGVVEASDPQSEADETRNKARGVLCAIEAAPKR